MVWRGYEAQKANRRAMRQAKQFVPQLPHVTTWLNGWRFEQEIDQPTGELRRQSMVERRCDVSGCTEFPIGRSFEGGWICRTHDLKIWGDQNREAFRALLAKHPRDRDESWRDWSWRTMAQCPIGCDLLLRMNIRVNRELDSTQKTDAEMRVAHYARLEEYANRTGDNNARRAAIEEQLRKIRAETAAQRAQVVE
jgi:hypothetical protein